MFPGLISTSSFCHSTQEAMNYWLENDFNLQSTLRVPHTSGFLKSLHDSHQAIFSFASSPPEILQHKNCEIQTPQIHSVLLFGVTPNVQEPSCFVLIKRKPPSLNMLAEQPALHTLIWKRCVAAKGWNHA